METKNNKNTTTTCPYAKKCGGCQYQGMDYAAQLKKKQKEMNKLLKDFRQTGTDHRYERPSALPK